MAKKGKTYLTREIVATPKGNYTIPSLEAFKEQKAFNARQHAAEHIQRQKAPNVPIVPSRSPWSIAAAIMGMSDQERIRMFGTADAQTCIYTATSQYKDKYARVSGNKSFRENPEKFGFYKVPMDSAKVGDLIQLTDFAGTPHHSTILTDKTKAGDLYVSYSNGHNEPYDVYEGDTIWTMKKNIPIEVFTDTDGFVDGDTPAAFRYQGSPGKQDEWTQEYINKYGLRKEDYFKTPTIPTYTEQPDALRVQKPLIKAEGGFLQPRDAWDRLSIPEKAEMMKVAVSHDIYNLNDIRQKYNEFAKGGDKEEVSTNTYSVGDLVDAIYQNNPREEYLGEPSHHYDFTQSEEWVDAHGYYPDARGHRDDKVKKPAHPSHPSRGIWNNDVFALTDIGMENPNYTMFGLTDGGQDPQAVLTYKGGVVLPEVTVTPKGNYFYNPYDNIRLHIKSEKSPTVNLFWNGGEEDSPFTPIAKPVIPRVEGDQEAVNWIANWYNNRREQLYNNIKESDGTKTFLYDVKDRLSGDPVGRRAINHEYYDKLNNIARYKTASFEDLKKDIPASYDRLSGEAFGTTEPSTNKVYYDNDLIQLGTEVQNRYEGFSPLGIHIHERTHTSGKTDGDGKFTGYNAQTEALENILRLKPGTEKDEYLDASPEIYGRMMEFRYNHNMNPKKRYSKQEIQKMLDQENRGFKSDLQRYDLDTLTKALNEVAQMDASQNGNIFLNEHV